MTNLVTYGNGTVAFHPVELVDALMGEVLLGIIPAVAVLFIVFYATRLVFRMVKASGGLPPDKGDYSIQTWDEKRDRGNF